MYVQYKKNWVSIDEATDVEGRYVTNMIIGRLEIDNLGKTFLLNSAILEKVNHSMITKLFDISLFIFWSEGVKYDIILFFG